MLTNIIHEGLESHQECCSLVPAFLCLQRLILQILQILAHTTILAGVLGLGDSYAYLEIIEHIENRYCSDSLFIECLGRNNI